MKTTFIENQVSEILSRFTPKFRNEALNAAYYEMEAAGHQVGLLNEKYLLIDGVSIQIRKAGNSLVAKAF